MAGTLNATAANSIVRQYSTDLKHALDRNTAAILAVGTEIIKAMTGNAPVSPQSIEQSVKAAFDREYQKLVPPTGRPTGRQKP
jgi:hypothetical protein